MPVTIKDAFETGGLRTTAGYSPLECGYYSNFSGVADAGLSRREPLDQALAGYQRRRDEASAIGYQTALRFASHQPPPPEELAIMRAVATSQEETDCFLGVLVGAVPGEAFYAPENVARIMAAAAKPATRVA